MFQTAERLSDLRARSNKSLNTDGMNSEIRGAQRLSYALQEAITHYRTVAETTENDKELEYANLSCIFFASSFFEARFNETATMFSLVEDTDQQQLWKLVSSEDRSLSFKLKWNIVAAATNGESWNSDKEPFQSWDEIFSLRNELVHYKSRLLEAGKVPVARLSHLAERLGIGDLHIGNEGSQWVRCFLQSRSLAGFIDDNTQFASDEMFPRMRGA